MNGKEMQKKQWTPPKIEFITESEATVNELTEICMRQAEIIRRQNEALGQLGAMIAEDERACSGLLEED